MEPSPFDLSAYYAASAPEEMLSSMRDALEDPAGALRAMGASVPDAYAGEALRSAMMSDISTALATAPGDGLDVMAADEAEADADFVNRVADRCGVTPDEVLSARDAPGGEAYRNMLAAYFAG